MVSFVSRGCWGTLRRVRLLLLYPTGMVGSWWATGRLSGSSHNRYSHTLQQVSSPRGQLLLQPNSSPTPFLAVQLFSACASWSISPPPNQWLFRIRSGQLSLSSMFLCYLVGQSSGSLSAQPTPSGKAPCPGFYAPVTSTPSMKRPEHQPCGGDYFCVLNFFFAPSLSVLEVLATFCLSFSCFSYSSLSSLTLVADHLLLANNSLYSNLWCGFCLLARLWLKEKSQEKSHLQKELIATELPAHDQHPIFFDMLTSWFDFRMDHIRQSIMRCWIFPPASLPWVQNKSIPFYGSIIRKHLFTWQRFMQ